MISIAAHRPLTCLPGPRHPGTIALHSSLDASTARPPCRHGDEAVRLFMARARQMAEKTRQSVERARSRSRAIQDSADAAVQRAQARLTWVRAAKQRLDDRTPG